MNIFILSTMEGFPWGGSEELWYQVATAALQNGHRVMVCVKEWDTEPPPLTSLRQQGAIIVPRKSFSLSLPDRLYRKFAGSYFIKSQWRQVKQFNPASILVSQGGSFDFFGDGLWWAFINSLNKPFSVISQSNLESGGILHRSTRLRLQEKNKLFKRFYFVSDRNRQTAERQAAMQFGNTQLIDNPVNIKKTICKAWPQDQVLQLACVARYDCAYKGQDILLQALSHADLKGFSFRLDLYGKGPDRDYLEQLAAFYQLRDKVKINEHVSDIDHIWEMHHVLVLSSVAEGTPLSLQECMLQGRPALVTDVGDCARLVADGITGFVVPGASVPAMRLGLQRLFATPLARLKEMGEKAFEESGRLINLHSASVLLQEITKE